MKIMSKNFITHSESETFELGKKFAENLLLFKISGLVVLMFGDLGTGKTVFVRGVGAALGVKSVRSPSFTLINEYKTNPISGLPNGSEKFLVHADLYRLDSDSVFSLGLEDYTDDFLFIEWSERLNFDLSDRVVKIFFEALDENSRAIKIISENENHEINEFIQNL